MKKPDLSKEALQLFMLNHAEKLIIAACAAGLGVLAWLGWKTPVFREKTPVDLSNLAVVQAESYLNSSDSWQKIESFRKLTSNPAEEVRQKTALDPAAFTMASLVGPLVKTAELRKDPSLVALGAARVDLFTAPVFYVPNSPLSRLNELPDAATASSVPGGESGPGRGAGAPGGSLGGAGDGGGGGRGGGGGAAAPPPVVERKIPGDRATELHRREFTGTRGYAKSARGEAFLMDFCQITATISVDELNRHYRDTLMGSRAWYPRRDKPAFYRIDVERQLEGETAWTNITERAVVDLPAQYGVTPVAEIVPPERFDDKITSPLPPITDFDYRALQTVAGLMVRALRPADLFAEATAKTDRPRTGNPFDENGGPGASAPAAAPAEGPPPLHWLFGTNMSAYQKAKPAEVQVRVIDLAPPKTGKFRYRIRVWIEDPNNTQDELIAGAKYFTSHFRPPTMNAGYGGGAGALQTGGAGGAMSDGGNNRGSGAGSGNKDDENDGFEFDPITEPDLDPAVRMRLRAQKAVRDKLIAEAQGLDAAAAKEKTREIWKTFCRPTEWSETGFISVNPAAGRARVALGGVQDARMAKVGELEFPREEPVAQLAASSWSGVFGAWVPAYFREVRRGDCLNVRAEFAHILNLADFVVKRLEGKKDTDPELARELEIRTNHIVVDVSGGRIIKAGADLPTPLEYAGQKDPRPYTIPGEMLVLDAMGNLRIHSEFDDLKAFRNSLFLEDETSTYGRVKAAPAEEAPNTGR